MELLTGVLQKNNLTLAQLPKGIQSDIDELKERTEKFNEAIDDYNEELKSNGGLKDADAEAKFDSIDEQIDNEEKSIVSDIERWISETAKAKAEAEKQRKEKEAAAEAEKQKEAAANKSKEEEEAAAAAEAEEKAKQEAAAAEVEGKEKEKGSSLGNWILGGLVLLATAGVVNIMRKK